MPSVGWPACMRAAKPGEGANVITPIGTGEARIPIATAELLHHQVRRNALRIAKVGLRAAHDAHVMAAAWARRRSSRHGDVAAFAVK